MSDESIPRMLDRLVELEQEVDEKKAQAHVLRSTITGRMIDEEIDSIKSSGGAQVTLSKPKLSFSVNAGDKQEFIEYLDSIGEGDVAQRNFHPATAKKLIEKILEDKGPEFIPEKFRDSIGFYQNITVRGGKK